MQQVPDLRALANGQLKLLAQTDADFEPWCSGSARLAKLALGFGDQCRGGQAQRARQFRDRGDGGLVLSCLDQGNEVALYSGVQAELLLGQTGSVPQTTQCSAERGAECIVRVSHHMGKLSGILCLESSRYIGNLARGAKRPSLLAALAHLVSLGPGRILKLTHPKSIHMAHNIGQMFYFGEHPWHGLGKRLEAPANLEQALSAGGLDWTVSMAALALTNEPESTAPQRMAIVRDDVLRGGKGRVLGVVHPEFKVLQNHAGAKLFDSLFGKGDHVYHTGGYLKSGEVVWLMAKLREDITLPGADVLNTYLLFSNSHDGSLPIDIRLTTVRVVCNNTLSFALSEKKQGHFFRRGHNGSYGLLKAEAEGFIASVSLQQGKVTAIMNKLVAAPCTDAAFAAFLTRLLPIPATPVTAGTNSAVRKGHDTRVATIVAKREQVMRVHLKGHAVSGRVGAVVPPAAKTWWGGLNSVTAWVDHVNQIDGDRFAQIMFGNGDRLKADAYQRILVKAGAA